ncbi:hypothetical protein PQX77_007761 [Marasmius sp. AFHP31]|nr:hypothetical protein PQX77_007761 [Marasmius sp. AFHP31]
METPQALPPHPRLRISRLSQPSLLDTSSQAGPSRFPDSYSPISNQYLHENDDHENQEDTPKLTSSSLLPTTASNDYRNVEETPVERLRALLSQVPNDTTVKARPRAPQLQEPSSASTMDLIDSDSDVPQIGSAHPSFARESLKDIFSRAIRDPDTPQKDTRGKARRRNSIDISEVEASPRVEKVQRDRNSNKGKRRSMSDDEVDPSSSASGSSIALYNVHQYPRKESSQISESPKFSQASTFQLLRERLSATALQDQSFSDAPSGDDNSADSDSFLKGLNSSQAPATSTPQHSVQHSLKMSVNSQFQSNLLDQDSEMQHAMDAFDSYEDSRSHAKQRFPASSTMGDTKEETSAQRENQSSRRKSTPNLSSFMDTHHSTSSHRSQQGPASKQGPTLHAFPRSASPALHAESPPSRSRTQSDAMHERELGWNRRQSRPVTPDLRHRNSYGPLSRSSSPMIHSGPRRSLSRHSSNTSIGSVDSFGDSSSQSGSVGSQAECEFSHTLDEDHPSYFGTDKELLKQRGQERSHELERQWNKPRPRAGSNASLNGLPERSRTHSIPSRPGSRLSISSPSFGRRSSSRAGSPTGSNMSLDSEADREREIQHEIEHERERNWNSPRPNWHARSRTNSDASIPPSPSPSPVPTTPTNPSPYFQRSTNSSRLRAESLKEKVSRSPGSSHSPGTHSIPRPSSRLSSTRDSPRSHSPTISLRFPNFPARPSSPTPSLHKKDPSKIASPSSSFSFPRSRTPLLDDSVSNIPRLQGHSRTLSSPSSSPHRSRSSRPSLIPTPAKGKGRESGPVPSASSERPRPSYSSTSIPTVVVATVESDVQDEGPRVQDDQSTGKHPYTLLDPALTQLTDTDEEGRLAEERTPVVKPTASLPSDSEIDVESSAEEPVSEAPAQAEGGVSSVSMSMSLTQVYSPAHMSKDEERLQKVLSSPDISFDETVLQTAIASPPSPPPSPPSEAPSTPEEQTQPLFDLPTTPPRGESFSSSTPPFQTPSPPKALPDLPGPPSSEDDTDSVEDNGPQELKSINTTALKTPKPPGAWSYTPAPQRQNGLLRSHSLPQLEEEPQYDSGLATPVASLSRASSVPPKTPALPGGWLTTPYPKSVRFETEESVATDQSALVSDSSLEPEANLRGASERLKQLTAVTAEDSHKDRTEDITIKMEKDTSTSSIATPPPSATVSPKPKSPGRKINILDEYGREMRDGEEGVKPKSRNKKKERQTSTPKSSVRIVDAMGREIDDTQSEEPTVDGNNSGEHMNRAEALSLLRDGLHDLQRGFDDLKSSPDRSFTQLRIEELKAESRHARNMRQRIQQRALPAEEVKDNFAALRESMRRSRILTPAPIRSSFSSWMRSPWLYWLFLAQFFLIFVMYRMSVSHAQHYFLTTYYDPYYPDLHLYHSTPEYPTQAKSLTELFWREGLRASALQVLDNVLITLSRWHNSAWRVWGADDIQLATAWPPT